MYDIGGSLPGNNTIRRMLYMIPGNRRERSATALLPFYVTCVYPVLRVACILFCGFGVIILS